MGLIDRFTRDAVSKYVWGGLLALALLALALTIWAGGGAVREAARAAERRGVAIADRVERELTGEPVAPVADVEGLTDAVLRHPAVSRVRVWEPDSAKLRFTTDARERRRDLNSGFSLNDEFLAAATGEVITITDFSDTFGDPADDPAHTLLRTYVPVEGPAGRFVVEVDHLDELTTGPVRSEWFRYRLLAAAAFLAMLVMTGLSLREPVDEINAGVVVVPASASASAPAGRSLVEAERLAEAEKVYRLANDRIERLKRELQRSEEVGRRLEGELQRRSAKAGVAPTAPALDRPRARRRKERAPAPPERVVEVPESGAAAPAAPALPPSGEPGRKPKPRRAPPRRNAVGLEGTESTPTEAPSAGRPTGGRTPRRAAAAERTAVSGTRGGIPGRWRPPTGGASEGAAPTAPPSGGRRAVGSRPAPTPSSAPAPAPAPTTAPAPESGQATSSAEPTRSPRPERPERPEREPREAAGDPVIRLPETDAVPEDAVQEDEDQAAVRAALARTAARKKLQSARLHRDDGPDEPLGEQRPGA
jgi:hypothetical protein